jgi:hypothetical protein
LINSLLQFAAAPHIDIAFKEHPIVSIVRSYTTEIRDNLNYSAAWFPNVALALGHVGTLDDKGFTYQTTLAQLGIPFSVTAGGAPATFTHVSTDAVTRVLKLAGAAPIAGSVLAQADAGLSFSFNRENATVFLATGCRVSAIADQVALKRAILDLHNAKQWDKDHVVISELVTADSTSVLVSLSKGGKVELRAKAGAAPAFEAMNVSGEYSTVHESSIGFNMVAGAGMTPLFRALGIRKKLFRTDVGVRGTVVAPSAAVQPDELPRTVQVDEVDYEFPDNVG